jgi:hypothetical protein
MSVQPEKSNQTKPNQSEKSDPEKFQNPKHSRKKKKKRRRR